MCPLTLTHLFPSWLANERHRNAWFLPTGVCSGQSWEMRTWPDRWLQEWWHCQKSTNISVDFSVTPGRPLLKVYMWAVKWRRKEKKKHRSRSIATSALVKSNGFQLLRAQPSSVSRNKKQAYNSWVYIQVVPQAENILLFTQLTLLKTNIKT